MNNLSVYLHQAFLIIHLFAFAFAIVGVVREDYRFLTSKIIDSNELVKVAKEISLALLILWISGIGLLAINPGLDLNAILQNEKVTSKLVIVIILTFNGLLLHAVVMPAFKRPVNRTGIAATLAALLGAISSVSWVFASLVGSARVVAPILNYQDYMVMYFICLIIAILVGYTVIRPRANQLFLQHSKVRRAQEH